MLFLLCLNVVAMAAPQQNDKIVVKGTVVDVTGLPLIGATVQVLNTNNGTVTDFDGKYELKNVPTKGQLVFSYVGMTSQTIQVDGRSTIDVTLSEDAQMLDAVVVIGYGSTKKSDITGSVASVKPEALNDIPANSIDGLLQGRVAGVQVINSSQDPGASSTIRIRGNSSLNGSNSPLVVVDGFPMGDAGDLKQINPQDIVSMEVLKDASASAIYGSRGANGVILVTTRKGEESKTKISVRQQTTFSQFTSEVNLWRDPVLMALLDNESKMNAGLQPQYIGAVNAAGVYYPSISELQSTWTTNTHWDDVVFRGTPVSNNTTIQVMSGNDRTKFVASANYYTDMGVYKDDDYKKYGATFTVDHKLYDNVNLKASANIVKSKRNTNNDLAYWRNPIFPIYNEDGSYFKYANNDYSNPVAITDKRMNKSESLDVISYAALNWQILPELKLTSQLNYKRGESLSDRYDPDVYTDRGAMQHGYGEISNWYDENIVSETYATFDKEWGKHHFTAMAGYSYENYTSRSSFLAANDFVNESLRNENLEAGNPEQYIIRNGKTETELVSGMGRLNYMYDNKYLATVTARVDGSSKFGEDNKYAFFPSGALSWKMHHEDFIKELGVFDALKLRASYGFSGNQGISPYQTLPRYGQHKYYNNGAFTTAIGPGYKSGYTGEGGIYSLWSGIANSELKWETTSQFDLGLEMSFFNRRLNVNFDYYRKVTDDLLRERNIASSSGYDRMWVNDGEISNTGVEMTIDGVIYHDSDWKVNGTLVLAHNKNKVESLGNAAQSGLNIDPNNGMEYEYYGNSLEQFRGYPNILAVGEPMFVFYGYKTNGIVQNYADGLASGLVGSDAEAGEFNYVDINGDGTVDSNDQTIIGDPNPDFTASLAFNVTYKQFDFNIFFNGVFGGDVLNTQAFSQPDNIIKRWTTDNPTQVYPRLNQNRQIKMSEWWIEDGSFVRIQNATVGYTVPKNKINFLEKVRIYASVDNLYTFTKFDGYDPEVGMDGIYYGGYPRLRKWTVGLDLTF